MSYKKTIIVSAVCVLFGIGIVSILIPKKVNIKHIYNYNNQNYYLDDNSELYSYDINRTKNLNIRLVGKNVMQVNLPYYIDDKSILHNIITAKSEKADRVLGTEKVPLKLSGKSVSLLEGIGKPLLSPVLNIIDQQIKLINDFLKNKQILDIKNVYVTEQAGYILFNNGLLYQVGCWEGANKYPLNVGAQYKNTITQIMENVSYYGEGDNVVFVLCDNGDLYAKGVIGNDVSDYLIDGSQGGLTKIAAKAVQCRSGNSNLFFIKNDDNELWTLGKNYNYILGNGLKDKYKDSIYTNSINGVSDIAVSQDENYFVALGENNKLYVVGTVFNNAGVVKYIFKTPTQINNIL